MKWEIVTPPTDRVIEDEDIEEHLRLDGVVQFGDQLHLMTDAATDYAQDVMACSLMPQTLRATFYECEPLWLPRGPVLEITSVTDGNDAAFSNYHVQQYGNTTRLVPRTGVVYPLTVEYRAGYERSGVDQPGQAVPAAIRLAILQHVASLYANRESVTDRAKIPVPQALEDFYRLKSRKVGAG